MECLSYCIASHIDINRLDAYCKQAPSPFHTSKFRDLLQLVHQDYPAGMVYVFTNGTLVCWNVKRYRVPIYRELILPFCMKPVSFQVADDFSYQLGEKTGIEPHGYFDVDCLRLASEDEEIKLSLSYGFSQSVKLQYFEMTLEALIEKYTPMIQSLTERGDMPITRKQIRQATGEILAAKSEMNLISNFLYHPKFFWQHPSLEENYIMLERYMHIQRRVNAINHRLDTINEVFDMFNAYLENRHSHSLEVIIIVLIAIEIIFGVLNFHF
ncbi:MAG: RMD1 family protein [Legionellaceae bacterium]|nr:RMD1 family protein [Legionellaceae bacterium]